MTLSHAYPRTANDRLKDSFQLRLALSFMAAVVLHTMVFELWPAMRTEPIGIPSGMMDVVNMPVVDIPPTPEAIPRPALPVPSATVAMTDELPPIIGWQQAAALPAPTPAPVADAGDKRVPFVTVQVWPSLLNPEAVERALTREYPPLLRETGVGGTVHLLVHVDARGNVLETRVGQSSGMESLDGAALRVADTFRFRPAMNRDRPVEVWIRLPVTFRVNP